MRRFGATKKKRRKRSSGSGTGRSPVGLGDLARAQKGTASIPAKKSSLFAEEMPIADVRRIFAIEKEKILQGWQRREGQRLSGASKDFDEHPTDWLVRRIYRLASALVRAGHSEVLTAMMPDVKSHYKGQTGIEGQPFKEALFIICGNALEGEGKPPLNRAQRSELGDGMAYAYRHNVQSKLVTAFIKQANRKLVRRKLHSGYCEPGFRIASLVDRPKKKAVPESKLDDWDDD